VPTDCGFVVKNPKIEARVPEEIERLVKNRAEKDNVTVSDIVRDALSLYFFGNGSLQGVDQGFLAARKIATKLAITALRQAMDIIPNNLEEAQAWCEEYIETKREG
jgi:hypothetical protein